MLRAEVLPNTNEHPFGLLFVYLLKDLGKISRPRQRLGASRRAAGHGLFFGRNQPVAHRVANQFGLVLQTKPLLQSGAVVLNGPRADVETRGNLRIRLSLHRQLQHLALSRRQGVVRIEWARLRLLNVVVDGNLRHRRTEKTSARGRLSHSADQILLAGAFEDVAECAVLERLSELLLYMDRITIRVRGKRSRRIRSASRPPSPGIIRSRTRMSGFNRSVRRTVFQAVRRNAGDAKIGFRLQKGLHPPANYRVIVRQHDGNGHGSSVHRLFLYNFSLPLQLSDNRAAVRR
jgi:hypothetical protein